MCGASPREWAAAEIVTSVARFHGLQRNTSGILGLAPQALYLRLLSQAKISGLVADTVRISDFHFLCKAAQRLERSDNPGKTRQQIDSTLKGLAVRGTLSGFNAHFLYASPGFSLRSNPGLKLVNACGVFQVGQLRATQGFLLIPRFSVQ